MTNRYSTQKFREMYHTLKRKYRKEKVWDKDLQYKINGMLTRDGKYLFARVPFVVLNYRRLVESVQSDIFQGKQVNIVQDSIDMVVRK